MNVRFERLLNPRQNGYGYMKVVLCRDGGKYERLVHRLVADAFIAGYHPGVKVKHADDDRGNNNVYNLRFSAGVRLGRLVRNVPRPTYRRLRIIETGVLYHSVEAAAKAIGGNSSGIYRVLRGERSNHKGYTFEFWEEK